MAPKSQVKILVGEIGDKIDQNVEKIPSYFSYLDYYVINGYYTL